MPDQQFREDLFAQFARIGKALSSPARLEIVYVLNQGEKSVDELAKAARLSVANASQHLLQLKGARLVDSRKRGQRVIYRLASRGVEGLWQCLQKIGEERLLEIRELVRKYMGNRDELEPVTRGQLLERMSRDEVIVVDVRPEDEYRAGHLPQAVSIPPGQLAERMASLPRDREIVAYCRGPYCLISYEAVEILRAHGFRAIRLEDGFPEWKLQDLPYETGRQGVS